MYNIFKKHRRWKLICAILSLSLLTVMAGAAVAPALGLIREHFADTDTGLVQMIVSMPAIFIAGGLAMISWRLSFMVYLLGLISVVLCLVWMPNDRIYDSRQSSNSGASVKQYAPYMLVMFVLSFTFFVYPASFALECSKSGAISQGLIAPVMAMMDVFGFVGGLAFSSLSKCIKKGARFIAPVLFIVSYVFLGIVGGAAGILIGSAFVGIANGIGVPFIMTSASAKAGKDAATTVMPLISAALYLAQFLTPVILSAVGQISSANSFVIALGAAVVLAAVSLTVPKDRR